ncbi:PREDICTED: UBP1-associated protein 2B-like [Fragaria vesca subsp. vesca]|uniref:UBP1-associated protein 2B-like n=1 Tax=Fragaria vesca subsp. vesca TaxID=101020 RepID=UPI0002C2DF97|nr:PREDICTED: UBP1-associated protein 2B-like [Fragaria vesca subsp. vesca]
MARKRKLDSNSAEASEPAKKQQQPTEPVVEEPKPQNEPPPEEVEEEVDEEEEEVEEEEEEYEEEEEVEEEETGVEYKTENVTTTTTSADPSQANVENGGEDDEDEPIQDLLEPFSKDQLVSLLKEAAESHRDVSDRIRKVADEDPIHRKIFVHGLGWDTTAETLTSVFTEYGEIEDCKAVCDKVSGKSKGYGFILFKTRSGARRALKQPQKKIGNRMTACQLASLGPAATPTGPGPAAVAAQSQPVSEYTQRKIYVSNVGADLDPQKLLVFFSRFGEIEEGPLGLDKATGRPKGFCLFVYKSPESAKRALEEPHKNFDGHILHCQKAIDGPKPVKSHHGNQHHHNRNKNSGGFGGGAPAGPGHMMAPGGAAGIGFNQGAASTQALNPALGQALALLATQGAGLNIFGTLGAQGVNPGVPGGAHGIQSAYGGQPSISPGMMGTYGNQGALPGGYPNPQLGQGGSGRGPHGLGQYGGAPYTGH